MVLGEHLVLLATAYAYMTDGFGTRHRCRLLCDPGSQVSFMTFKLFHTLALRRQKGELHVAGVGSSSPIYTRGRAVVRLSSTIDITFGEEIDFHLLDSITSPTPVTNIADSCWTHLRSLPLADPTFGSTGRIDALLGADVWGTIIQDGITRGSPDEPWAQCTRLGWIVFGPAAVDSTPLALVRSLHGRVDHSEQRLDEVLRRFWELEEASNSSPSTSTDNLCERLFMATSRREPDGRYVVQIPFRPDAPAFGNSHQLALRQFHQLEKRLLANPELRTK